MRDHIQEKRFDEKVTDIALDFFKIHGNFPKEITCEGKTVIKQEHYTQLEMVLYKSEDAIKVKERNSTIISWNNIAKVKPKLKLKK